MSNFNAIAGFDEVSVEDLQNSLGITQFSGEFLWSHVIGGLLIQGGKVLGVGSGALVTVPFAQGFVTQCLGVFIQPISGTAEVSSINNVTTAQFDIINGATAKDFFWWAIGV